jgi:hypothetical protein
MFCIVEFVLFGRPGRCGERAGHNFVGWVHGWDLSLFESLFSPSPAVWRGRRFAVGEETQVVGGRHVGDVIGGKPRMVVLSGNSRAERGGIEPRRLVTGS